MTFKLFFQALTKFVLGVVVVGTLLSVLFLCEHLTPTLLLAALIMATGCFLAAK